MSVGVRFLGHLGNNLFQYALGRVLAEDLGLALRCLPASETPGFGAVERASGIVDRLEQVHERFADVPLTLAGRRFEQPQLRYVMGEKPGWSGHALPFDRLLRGNPDRRFTLHGYFQRTEYYHPHRERIRRWFALDLPAGVAAPGPRDVVVHLRQSLDMKLLDRALDMGYYSQALSGTSPGTVYACGLGIDEPAVREALAPWRPHWLRLPAIDTLALMTRAHRIVLANSTFSWWGAYLASQAEVIFPRPERGFWSAERPEVDLEVPEDRYRYVDDVPIQDWRPWRWQPASPWRLDEGTAPAQFVGPHRETPWPLPAELLPCMRWVTASGGEPFGLPDLYAQGLPVSARRTALQWLVSLARVGALLEVEPGSLAAVARHYGAAPA